MTKEYALQLLHTPPADREALYIRADALRKETHGDAVPIRGIIEFSNICANDCLYCGIRKSNTSVRRYSLSADEILETARKMSAWHQGTLVLQSGETPSPERDKWIGEVVRRVKAETGLAVTLSVGNRPKSTYAFWQDCGMDRYLLRFETSSRELFTRIHPDCSYDDRIRCLRDLKDLGVQTGSGFMVGLPGETDDILADNIVLCRDLGLDMIGFGPFIPSPGTPMAETRNRFDNDRDMFFVTLAVLRIFNPLAHIPATTAFDAVFPGNGRLTALTRGANVFMPNNTPASVRDSYKLYPGKPSVDTVGAITSETLPDILSSVKRPALDGPGHSLLPGTQRDQGLGNGDREGPRT